MQESIGLLTDILTLLGAFFLGFLAGIVFTPLQRFVIGIWHAPSKLFKGAQNASAKLRQAFRAVSEEEIERTGLTGALACAVSNLLTLRVRHAEANFCEGITAFDRGDYKLARRKFLQAMFWDNRLELKPLHVLAHLRLGWLDEERGALRAAKEHYKQAVRLDASNLAATVHLGMTYFRLGETGPAIFQFQRALELDPADLDTHYYLYAIYRQAKMEREALEQLRIIKAGENAEALVELFSRHGEDNFRLARYAEAIDDYELALQVDPCRIQLYVDLGDLYYLQQQMHTALETWCRGLWIDYSEALAERVLAIASKGGDIWPVINLVRDSTARHYQDGRYHFLLAKLLRQAGEAEESVDQLKQAVQLTPQLLEAQEELGDWFAQSGWEAEALMAYRAGLSAAHLKETVYRCRACAYVTKEKQARCFGCNRWGTLEEMARGEAEAILPLPNLLERASAIRQSLSLFWGKIAGQLPQGH